MDHEEFLFSGGSFSFSLVPMMMANESKRKGESTKGAFLNLVAGLVGLKGALLGLLKREREEEDEDKEDRV